MGNVQMLSQTRDAGFSKQNYYEKIDKNQRKILKLWNTIGKGVNLKKKNVKN